MTNTGTSAAILLIAALLLAVAPGCAKKPPMTPRFQPLIEDPSSPPSPGSEVRFTLFSTLDLGLRHLDSETRARYLEEVAGQDGDPFSARAADQGEAFLVFLFSVENRGTDPVLISPAFASLVDRKNKVNLSPIDARELAGILAANPAYTPEVSRRLHPATINVNPGQRLAKLLVFPAMGSTPEAVEVIFPSVISGSLSGDAHFPFAVNWSVLPVF